VKEVEGFVGKGRVKSKVFLLQFVACYWGPQHLRVKTV
jgi:hypothetical protein